jgi:hypothetical protein
MLLFGDEKSEVFFGQGNIVVVSYEMETVTSVSVKVA